MNTPTPRRLFASAALLVGLLAGSVTIYAQQYTYYDLVVPTTPTSAKTVIDGTGRIMPANRSYVIGLEGGTRGPIEFTNWTASNPLYPVIVVNKPGNGRVVISDLGSTNLTGIAISNCSFFKVLGNNDPAYYYGIEIARAGGSQRGISAGNTTTNLEIAYTEVHNVGFAGIMAKTDPIETKPETWAANFVMRDVYIHDNYVHDTGGEGMYIGLTGWSTDNWTTVPGYEGHEIKGLKVGYNLIERTGWDGLQYASAPDDPSATDDDAEIFNNVIHSPAQLNAANQNAGFVIGGGAGGKVHNNIVIGGPGVSMSIFGRGYNTVYNNLLAGGAGGIFADNRGTEDPRRTVPGSYQSIYNNTIVVPTGHAYWTMNEVTVNNFKNNLSVVFDTNSTDHFDDGGSTVNVAGNVLLRTDSGVGFVNPTENDYRILSSSSAVNAGVSLASLPAGEVPVTSDFQDQPRPQGSAYDAGFSEFGALSVLLIATPPTTGNTGSIKASVIGGTSPYTYAWSTGATSQTITNQPQGLYSVTVTDSVGAKMTRATYLANGAATGAPVRTPLANEVLPPTFSPAPGTFTSAQNVTLATATSGASIRYTTNGSTPTLTSGTVYSGPIAVSNSTVITAIAYKSGMTPSVVTQGTFVIDNAPQNSKLPITGTAESSHTTPGGSLNDVTKTIDGDLNTQWTANGDGAWVSYDLGANVRFGNLYLAWYNASVRVYTFDLQVSTDNVNWTNVLTAHESTMNAGLQSYDIPDVDPVRYVRIVTHGYVQGTTGGTGTALQEVEIWGGATGGAVAPTITSQPQSQNVVAGANVTFSVTATGSPTPTYQWRKDGVNLSGATSVSYTITNVQSSHAGNYSVVVTNSAGSVTSNNATLTVGSSSLGVIQQAEDAVVVGALVRTNQTGYTGTGFVDYINASSDYIEWTISNPTAAARTLTFRYAMTGSPRTLSIAVNGTVVNSAFSFTTTGGSNIWALTTTTASLPAGTVTIRLTATGTSGPNVDYLQVD